MCLLCGGCLSKMVLKNVRWEKNKKHRVGLSVGSIVPLKYGLYVGHLSKWFTFSYLFNGHFLLCRVVIRLQLTFCGFAKKRISELKTFNIAQKLMRGRMFNDHFTRFFAKPLLAGRCSSLFVFRNSKSKVVNFKF